MNPLESSVLRPRESMTAIVFDDAYRYQSGLLSKGWPGENGLLGVVP